MQKAQQLGRYLLLDRIAYGGMAEIFRAKTFDEAGRVHLVAVKRVLQHLVEDEDFLQMMIDEARISAQLHHDNIARLYEFAHANNEYFLAMEFVDGRDLRSLIERTRQTNRKLQPEHVAWIAMEAARALHAAHTQRDAQGRFMRIVHRDVSPSNLLLSYRGEVKLCDFGIAKATTTRIQTKTGVIKGKVKYMSPEQALGKKLDHRSDLFSLGTVMYEMLALTPPFLAQTEVELIFAVREARKKPLSEVRPDVPPGLAAIVEGAMTRSRGARYQTGEEMARRLRTFLDEYAPGYRRAHFAQFMRQVFKDDIDRDLRMMEDFVLQEADGARIGENLIADVLGPDAPFTKFTPMVPPGMGTGSTETSGAIEIGTGDVEIEDRVGPFPGPGYDTGPSRNVHVEPTRIVDRSIGDVHAQETRIVDRSVGDIHVQPTRMVDRASLGLAPAPSINEAATRIVDMNALHEARTRIQSRPRAAHTIHDEQTRLVHADSIRPSRPGRRPSSIHDEDTGEREIPGPEPEGAGTHVLPETGPIREGRDDHVLSEEEQLALLGGGIVAEYDGDGDDASDLVEEEDDLLASLPEVDSTLLEEDEEPGAALARGHDPFAGYAEPDDAPDTSGPWHDAVPEARAVDDAGGAEDPIEISGSLDVNATLLDFLQKESFGGTSTPAPLKFDAHSGHADVTMVKPAPTGPSRPASPAHPATPAAPGAAPAASAPASTSDSTQIKPAPRRG